MPAPGSCYDISLETGRQKELSSTTTNDIVNGILNVARWVMIHVYSLASTKI